MTGLHYYSLLWQVCYLNDTLWQFSCIYICWETTNLQPLLVWFAITVFTIPISLVRCFKQAHLRFLLKERCFENVLKSSLNARNEKKDIYVFFSRWRNHFGKNVIYSSVLGYHVIPTFWWTYSETIQIWQLETKSSFLSTKGYTTSINLSNNFILQTFSFRHDKLWQKYAKLRQQLNQERRGHLLKVLS